MNVYFGGMGKYRKIWVPNILFSSNNIHNHINEETEKVISQNIRSQNLGITGEVTRIQPSIELCSVYTNKLKRIGH